MTMEAYILGCGGMMPLPNRHLTSALLRRDGELLLFDCGEGTQVSIRSLSLRWKKISAIFISHTHADHITGLPGILMLSSQVERSEPLYIIGPPRVAEYVATARRVLEMHINYQIIVREIADYKKRQTVLETDEYTVCSFPLDHTRECVGYSVIEKERAGKFFPEKAEALGVPCGKLWSELQHGKTVRTPAGDEVSPGAVMGPARGGRKFSYVTDSRASVELSRDVAHSDLLICEGMFEKGLAEIAYQKGHMTADDAGMLAKIGGDVLKLVLVHFSPRYTNREVIRLQDDARKHFAEAYAARDGQKFDIPFRD